MIFPFLSSKTFFGINIFSFPKKKCFSLKFVVLFSSQHSRMGNFLIFQKARLFAKRPFFSKSDVVFESSIYVVIFLFKKSAKKTSNGSNKKPRIRVRGLHKQAQEYRQLTLPFDEFFLSNFILTIMNYVEF